MGENWDETKLAKIWKQEIGSRNNRAVGYKVYFVLSKRILFEDNIRYNDFK